MTATRRLQRAELETVRRQIEGMRQETIQDLEKLVAKLPGATEVIVPDTPVSRFVAEEGREDGREVGGHSLLRMPSSPVNSNQAKCQRCDKLEQDVRRLEFQLSDRPDESKANADDAAVEVARQELEGQRATIQQLQSSLSLMEAAKREAEVANAALEASRANVTKNNEQLTGQLAQLQVMMAQQEGGATELLDTMRRELRDAQGQTDHLSEKVATLSAEKAHLEQLLASAQISTEELREEVAMRTKGAQAAASKASALESRMTKALHDQEQAEKTLSEQTEAMAAREAKAAKECERMFKLVQQAHEKVVAKEKEYAGRVAADKKKWDTELEKILAQRMKSLQKKYDEESNQRRKLFNQIQELKGNIRVYCRVRPCLSAEEKELGMGIEFVGQHNDLLVANPDRPQLAPKRFEFEKVFTPGTSQAQVFDEIKDLATSVTDGYNVCIFAYGQTGSGKTHTMEGTPRKV